MVSREPTEIRQTSVKQGIVRIFQAAVLLFAVFTLGVFSAENRIVAHFKTSVVLILGPRWGPRFVVPGLPCLDRKGARCRVLARGSLNTAYVEFQPDGERHFVSRNALRKIQTSDKTAGVSANGED
jgi:hypothetical protein